MLAVFRSLSTPLVLGDTTKRTGAHDRGSGDRIIVGRTRLGIFGRGASASRLTGEPVLPALPLFRESTKRHGK